MKSCPLCKLTYGNEIKTKVYYINSNVMIVDCLSCKTPMLVIKKHGYVPSPGERAELIKLCEKVFGKEVRFRGWMAKYTQHFHEHIIL